MLAESTAAAAAQPHGGLGTIAALFLFIAASVWIAMIANRAMQKGSFLKGFFLGNRGLGSWALALTATVQSGGTFMGFPSLVYTHGWIVALWIGSYMVVPLTGFAILGKRMAHLSRRTGAITLPDLFRERFGSPTLGLIASLFIMFYMSFMMVAQFKAGAIVMKLSLPNTGVLALAEDVEGGLDNAYYFGLAVFTITVVGYTMLGGFLAAVWTDLFQSVMMLVGVVILLFLTLGQTASHLQNSGSDAAHAATPPPSYATTLERASQIAAEKTGPEFVFGPGYDPKHEGRAFLPLGLAASFFFVWVFSGLGSPAGIVRIMASKNTGTIRRSIYLLSFYNSLIYVPLIVICICGRVLMPDLDVVGKTDEIIPRLALSTTQHFPLGSFIGGLILAAPFGAVMATVSAYLVVISSGLVRDVYQRFLSPHASERQLRFVSTFAMVAVGAIAVAANIKPVQYLQAIVVFSGTGAAATFCMPALMIAYWRRATTAGVLASMICGATTMLALYGAGFAGYGSDQLIGQVSKFRPYYLFGLDPLIYGLAASFIAGIVVSRLTTPPDHTLVSKLFDAEPAAPAPATA